MNAMSPSAPLSVFIVAAEESGDILGAALARALALRHGNGLRLNGVGGLAMTSAGITSPFAIDDLSIIGLSAIPRRLPKIFRRIRETADAVVAARPNALVIVDSPEFTHRIARRVRRLAPFIPIVDYVSPSVWAWRPGRARSMRGYVDHVLAILPFEPAVHVSLDGPPCSYVGHPLVEHIDALRPDSQEARRRESDPPVVLVLPGSRGSEIRRLLAIFGGTIQQVAARQGPIELVLPTVAHVLEQVREGVASWKVQPRIVVDPAEKRAAFRVARAALAASGTVTLELALAGVPTVAAYRLPRIEELILRLHVQPQLNTVILANLVIGEKIVPEFLQADCVPERLAEALSRALADTPQRRRQTEAFARLDSIMEVGTASPSAKAADIVLDIARRGRRDAAALVGAPRSP
jgi:lipid-A-disaccharide synthase